MQFVYTKKITKEKVKIKPKSDLSLIDFTLEQLVESDFHLGSKFNQFNKLNFNYIFLRRFKFLIINLAYSLYNLKLAVYFISIIVSRRGKVLFYDGGFDSMRIFVRFIGLTSKQHAVGQKWIAGLLTNFKEFYPAVFTGVSRHFRFPRVNFRGMRYIHRPPNVFCSLNIDKGAAAFLENFRLGIPVIALVNLDTSFAGLTFPVFSNSSLPHTHMTFFSILRSAVLNGYKYEVYKFYRRSLKHILKVRFIRQYLARRVRCLTTFFQFRLFFLRLVLDHQLVFFKFIKFLLYFIIPNSKDLLNFKNYERLFGDFRSKFAYFRSILLAFFLEHLFPVFENIFFFDIHAQSKKNIFNSKNLTFDEFLKFIIFVFSTEDRFLNFFFKLVGYLELQFFSSNFFTFVDVFFVRVFPLLIFLFKNFLGLDKTIEPLELSKFFKSLNLFGFAFSTLKLAPLLKIFNTKFNVFHFHVLYDYFSVFQYQKKKIPNFRTSFFSKFFKFRLKNVPLFVGFNFFSFPNLSRFVLDFSKNFGFFSYFKFSKVCKRFLRRSARSQKFIKFLFSSVYKKRNFLYFDFKISKFVILSPKFVKLNQSKSFFKARYLAFFYLLDAKSYHSKVAMKIRNKFNSFLLAFFDEEYDDSKFPLNNEFFYFQVGYGSAYLTRQHQRNKILEARRLQLRRGVDPRKKKVRFLKRKYMVFRLSFYFSSRLF